jgi:hypothetical protein
VNLDVLYYGGGPAPRLLPLRAGPLTLWFDPAGGDLRYIRLGEREVVRRIYVAVRDRYWRTVPVTISQLEVAQKERSFALSFVADHRQGDIAFRWQGQIAGEKTGQITYQMDGAALSSFLRNRIGICVLHPVQECAGARCYVEHTDGRRAEGTFPLYVAPHQPFKELVALEHPVYPDVWARVELVGDVFEMEDQLNWADASFKIYSTPLELPHPVLIAAGEEVHQKARLCLRGNAAAYECPARGWDEPTFVEVGREPLGPLPAIGLALPEETPGHSREQRQRLRALGLAHLRLDLDLASEGWQQRLRAAASEAEALSVPLEIALFLSGGAAAQLGLLQELLLGLNAPICRFLVLDRERPCTDERSFALARERLQMAAPQARFAAGTNLYFAELNRNPLPEAAEMICFSLNPQVHSSDTFSIIENLPAQRWVLGSAKRVGGGRPVAVSPVTLRPRFNPHGAPDEPASGELPASVDRRQFSLLGAGWTVGSLRHLAEAGAASVTYYETVGWRGVMAGEAGSPTSQRCPSSPGTVYPVYHALAAVGRCASALVLPTLVSKPLAVEALALRCRHNLQLIVANLSGQTQQVLVRGLGVEGRVRFLDERNASAALAAPEAFWAQEPDAWRRQGAELRLELLPYGLAIVSSEQ